MSLVHFAPSDIITNQSKLLVGADEFKNDFESMARSSKRRLFVQAMTLEGDRAGEWLIETVISSNARHRMIVFDDYSNVVVNDTMVYGPRGLFNRNIKKEHKVLRHLLSRAIANGVRICVTNKIGYRPYRYPFRNHKKSAICDDHLWLGGINFSDHNFEWLDFMARFNDPGLAEAIAEDVQANAEGVSTSRMCDFGKHRLYLLNYRDNSVYRNLFDDILEADESIDILSPYITDPLMDLLRQRSKSLDIRIYTPGKNNKSLFTRYLRAKNREGWFQLYELPDTMSHMKAILTDKKTLYLGSSNFDFASYYFEDEIMLRTQEDAMVHQFSHRILDAYRNASVLVVPENDHRFSKIAVDKIAGVLDYIHSMRPK